MKMCMHDLDCIGVEPFSQATFGQGAGRIWLDNVQCTGRERVLLSCTVSSSGNNSCTHARDAGVRCPTGIGIVFIVVLEFSTFVGCTEGEIRLLEGGNLREGRVEICKNNGWGTVCHSGWTNVDARVVCRQLGYSVAGIRTQGELTVCYDLMLCRSDIHYIILFWPG